MRLNLLVFAALCVSVSVLSGQTVHGKIVSDSAAVPLANVLISLMNEKGDTVAASVRSSATGDFVIRSKDPGRYHIKATRLAFAPVTTSPFDLNMRTEVEVRLVMNRQAILLTPMVVVSSRVMSGADMMSVEGFEWRRLRYTGVYLDTAGMRQSNYPPFSQILKDAVPGLYTVSGFTGNEEIRITVRGAECMPDLYTDGNLQGSLIITHLNLQNPADFYGIEIFKRPNIPIEYRRTGIDCAVIALWTKWAARGRGRGRGRG